MRGTVECLDAVEKYLDLVRTKTGIIIPKPIVKFDLRGTKAGEAWAGHGIVRFNPILLDENPEHFVRQTVGHEIAHLAARTKYGNGISSHGVEWRNIMYRLGLPAKRCHNYDVSTVTGRKRNSLAIERF